MVVAIYGVNQCVERFCIYNSYSARGKCSTGQFLFLSYSLSVFYVLACILYGVVYAILARVLKEGQELDEQYLRRYRCVQCKFVLRWP